MKQAGAWTSSMAGERIVSLVLGCRIDASPVDVPSDVVLRRCRWIPALGGRLSRLGGPAGAVTLGRTILFHPRARITQRLVRHELAHVLQWKEESWFPVRYTLETLLRGYRANRYERAARAAEAPPPPTPPTDS